MLSEDRAREMERIKAYAEGFVDAKTTLITILRDQARRAHGDRDFTRATILELAIDDVNRVLTLPVSRNAK